MSLLQRQILLLRGVILLLICTIINGLPTDHVPTYDQRQSGHVNIQISVKDLKIVALLGGGLGGSEVGTYVFLTVFYEMPTSVFCLSIHYCKFEV